MLYVWSQPITLRLHSYVTPRLARASKITDTRKRPGRSTVVMLTRACWFTELKPIVIYNSVSYTFLKYYSYIFFTRLWELGRINILHLILLERCVDHNWGAFTRVLDSCYIRQLGIRLPLHNAGPLWKDEPPRFDYFILQPSCWASCSGWQHVSDPRGIQTATERRESQEKTGEVYVTKCSSFVL